MQLFNFSKSYKSQKRSYKLSLECAIALFMPAIVSAISIACVAILKVPHKVNAARNNCKGLETSQSEGTKLCPKRTPILAHSLVEEQCLS